MPVQPNTVIESLGVYLPPRAVSTREVLDNCRRRILFPLEMITGIRSRRMAEDEFSFDLAVRAVSDCLSQSKYSSEDIDLLLCCNISRYDAPNSFSYEPSTSLRLKEKFGFPRALTFDLSNACAGVFTGIMLVDSFLKAGVIRRGMVVSGEYITHITETAQRELKGFTDPRLACLTLGDSGVALILEPGKDQTAGFLEMEMYTLGQHSHHCIAKASDKPGGGAIMLTNVVKLSSVAVEEATTHAVAVQRRAEWQPEHLNHLIMHQTSERTINDAMERVNRLYGKTVCTAGNTINNLRERGNTATTSHFVAFRDHAVTGRIQSGQNVIFSVNASGLTIGTSAYICDDLPARIKAHSANGHVDMSKAPLAEPPLESEPATGVRIESIGVLPPHQPVQRITLEMSRAAAEACLETSGFDRSEIDVLIYAGVYRTEYLVEPAMAAMIAGELALHDCSSTAQTKRTLCFDIQSGAPGLLKAFCAAARLIQSGRAQRVMVVTSEIDCNSDRPGKTLLGLEETASAAILEAAPSGGGFTKFAFRDFPEHWESFRSHCDLSVPAGVLEIQRDPRLENLYLDCLSAAVDSYLRGAGVARSEIKVVLGPQISPSFLHCLGQRLGFPPTALVDATSGHNDLFTSSLPYAFWKLQEQKTVQAGDLGLCLAVGSGIQVGCALYRF